VYEGKKKTNMDTTPEIPKENSNSRPGKREIRDYKKTVKHSGRGTPRRRNGRNLNCESLALWGGRGGDTYCPKGTYRDLNRDLIMEGRKKRAKRVGNIERKSYASPKSINKGQKRTQGKKNSGPGGRGQIALMKVSRVCGRGRGGFGLWVNHTGRSKRAMRGGGKRRACNQQAGIGGA